MATKLVSGEWEKAADENRTQRDQLRKAFYAQAGVQPASSTRQIFKPQSERFKNLAHLFSVAKDNRVGDVNLTEITQLTERSFEAIGLGSCSLTGLIEHQPLSFMALSPEVLKNFFSTDQETAIEKSLF